MLLRLLHVQCLQPDHPHQRIVLNPCGIDIKMPSRNKGKALVTFGPNGQYSFTSLGRKGMRRKCATGEFISSTKHAEQSTAALTCRALQGITSARRHAGRMGGGCKNELSCSDLQVCAVYVCCSNMTWDFQ